MSLHFAVTVTVLFLAFSFFPSFSISGKNKILYCENKTLTTEKYRECQQKISESSVKCQVPNVASS
jgi:hypothetical protein